MTDAAKLLSIVHRLQMDLKALDQLEIDDTVVRGEVQLAACQVQYALDILERCRLFAGDDAADKPDRPH